MLTNFLSNTYSYYFGDNHSATKFYYLSLIKEDDEIVLIVLKMKSVMVRAFFEKKSFL